MKNGRSVERGKKGEETLKQEVLMGNQMIERE